MSPNNEQTTGTAGGKSEQPPVVVWEAANQMEAEIVRSRLEAEGIPAIIRGEAMGPIMGLTMGGLAAAAVLVPAPLAERALALLEAAAEVLPDLEEDSDDEDVDNTAAA